MKKSLVYLLLSMTLTLDLFARSSLTIDSNSVNVTNFSMSYYIDTTQTMSFEDIKKQPFTDSVNKLSLGTDAKTTWSKVVIENNTSSEKDLFLHHPYAYHNKSISFFQEQEGRLIKSDTIDLDHLSADAKMYRGSAIFEFRVPKGVTTTLYIKSVSFSHQWFTLLLFDEDHSKRALSNTHNDMAFLVGVLLALMIYNLLLYFSSKKQENLLYSLYLVSASIWISLSYGLWANVFDVYGTQTLKFHISLIVMPIFLILFIMNIFETKRRYKREHTSLQFMIVLLSMDLIYGLFDILGALKHASSLAALMMLITISVSISLVRKGDPVAKYFLIGHSFFLLFNGIAVLFYKGIIEFTYITSHGVGIGIMLEALMLAFIISYRIKMLEDIKRSQDELKLLAATDPLTKLYNRRYFYTAAEYILNVSKRDQTNLCVLMLDIDEFKKINDTYGHKIGDDVLIRLSQTLQELSRSSDIVSRFGGEEFVILLPKTDIKGAAVISEKIRKEVEALTIKLKDKELKFTISIGVSQIDQESDANIEVSINRADKALYDAKNKGKNRVCIE